MFYTLLLVVQIIIAAALVTVILMQRSEGGGLAGGGGGTSGLMNARGVGDFLTRTTAVLGTLFIINSIGLAVLASVDRTPRKIDTSLSTSRPVVPAADTSAGPVRTSDAANEGADSGASSPVPLAE